MIEMHMNFLVGPGTRAAARSRQQQVAAYETTSFHFRLLGDNPRIN